jgi:serine protease Do
MPGNGLRFSLARRLVVTLAVLVMMLPGLALSALPDLIERVKPSVVAVGTFDRTRSPAFILRGTGFVLGNGNLVATNAHVIPEPLNASGSEAVVIRLTSSSGEVLQRVARVAASDKSHDLALLRIEGVPLQAIPLHNGVVREGQSVVFMGFPIGTVLGLSTVTHRGIISAITPVALPGASAQQLNEKVIKRLKSGTFNVYQLDGTAYPGNSGGPLLDADTGEVIGVINMVFVKGTKESVLSQPSGITFAIPVQHLQELLQGTQ